MSSVQVVSKVTIRKTWNRTFQQAELIPFSENRQSPVRPRNWHSTRQRVKRESNATTSHYD